MRSCADRSRHCALLLCALVLSGFTAVAQGSAAEAAVVVPANANEAGAVAPREPGTVPSIDEAAALRLGQAAVGRQVPDVELRDREGRQCHTPLTRAPSQIPSPEGSRP